MADDIKNIDVKEKRHLLPLAVSGRAFISLYWGKRQVSTTGIFRLARV